MRVTQASRAHAAGSAPAGVTPSPAPAAPMRRRWLRAVLVGAGTCAAASFAACGFALRGAPPLPFRRLALAGFAPASPLKAALREQLAAAPGTERTLVVDAPQPADATLVVLRDVRQRSVVASTAAGQVREVRLRLELTLRVDAPDGETLMPATTLEVRRDVSWSETAALSKQQEEAEIFAAMQDELIVQLRRRLAALRRPAAAGAAR